MSETEQAKRPVTRGGELAHRYGVRVAGDARQAEGYRPPARTVGTRHA